VQFRPVAAASSGSTIVAQAGALALASAPSLAPIAAMSAPQPTAQAVRAAHAEPIQAPLGLEVPQAPVQAAQSAAQGALESAPAPKPVLRPTADRNEPFIPPRAAEPELAREPVRAPDAFREAAMVDAGGASSPRRPNLLERITRTGRARASEAPAQPRPEPAATKSVPTLSTAPQKAAAKAPTLGGMEPADRPTPPREEDLLDIPAFLRRQAN
jgi:cell division protein FtsZ